MSEPDYTAQMGAQRRAPKFAPRETKEAIEEVYRLLDEGEKILTITRMTSLSFNTVHKLREAWRDKKEAEKRTVIIRAVPQIRLSDKFIIQTIQDLDTVDKYMHDPVLGPISSMLSELLVLREKTDTKIV